MKHELDELIQTITTALPLMIKGIRESGALADLAALNWIYFEDLLAQGFSREEALQIVINSKILPDTK